MHHELTGLERRTVINLKDVQNETVALFSEDVSRVGSEKFNLHQPTIERLGMKKIITPAVREEYETLCDATGKPAVAGLVMYFWYGSSHDGYRLKVDMCDEVAEDVLKLLQSKYSQFKPEDNHEMWLHCPLCERHA